MSKLEFPPIGCNRRYMIFADDKPYSGFDDFAEACRVATMYKKPGNPKRAENANEKIIWTVKDMNSGGAVLFTAPSSRKNKEG